MLHNTSKIRYMYMYDDYSTCTLGKIESMYSVHTVQCTTVHCTLEYSVYTVQSYKINGECS